MYRTPEVNDLYLWSAVFYTIFVLIKHICYDTKIIIADALCGIGSRTHGLRGAGDGVELVEYL